MVCRGVTRSPVVITLAPPDETPASNAASPIDKVLKTFAAGVEEEGGMRLYFGMLRQLTEELRAPPAAP